MTLEQPRQRSSWGSRFASRLVSAALIGVLTAALLISGLVTVTARTRLPRPPLDPTYQSLYVGLEQLSAVSPGLQVSTSLAATEKNFLPVTSSTPSPVPSASGPQLYVGLTLARFSCRPDYLAGITYGPGARLRLSVEQKELLPGQACFQLIGPLMYQVVALPLSQFPARLKLEVVVDRPAPLNAEQTYFRIPSS